MAGVLFELVKKDLVLVIVFSGPVDQSFGPEGVLNRAVGHHEDSMAQCSKSVEELRGIYMKTPMAVAFKELSETREKTINARCRRDKLIMVDLRQVLHVIFYGK